MTGFQRLCIVACVVVFGLIVLGGVVRATDSGLGCPDWPRCHGNLIPPFEKAPLIEYSHRLTASIAGFLILGVAIGAWRSYRKVPAIVWSATLTLGLVIFQALLGRQAVVNELPPEVVVVHLGTALTILTLLMLIAATASVVDHPRPRPTTNQMTGLLAAFALAWTLVLMLVGSYVSGAGYSLACSGWPLCNGEVVPSVNAASVQIIFLHRVLALTAGLLVLGLFAVAVRDRAADPFAARRAGLVLVVFVVQALVGAANVWTQLADGVAGAHLALGTLIWVLLAGLTIHQHHIYDLLPHATTSKTHNDLAEAAR